MMYDMTKNTIATENQITITDQGVEVNLKSDLKNYFVGNSSLQYVGEKIFHFMDDYTITRNVAVFYWIISMPTFQRQVRQLRTLE